MTVSMLMGEHGQQKEELEKMIDWIVENCDPDVIHLSNALLLGLAGRLSERMKIPVVCSLQDEDVWVDAMKPEARQHIEPRLTPSSRLSTRWSSACLMLNQTMSTFVPFARYLLP
jgi:hypothetical protein